MLVQIRSGQDASLPFIQHLYETSFPRCERRDWVQLLGLLSYTTMELLLVHDAGAPIGFAVRWPLGTVQYLEHFAIDPAYRGQQYGSRVVQQLIAAAPGQLILEVEPPGDALSLRRIRFYERHGFVLAPYDYHQPPYRRAEQPVPMRLMSLAAIGDEGHLQAIAHELRTTVYEPFWE